MLRPASEMAAVAEEAARVQADKDAAKAERFVRDTVASDIEAAAALGRRDLVIVGERLPSDAVCKVAVGLLTAAGYSAIYEPQVSFDFTSLVAASGQLRPAILTVRWSGK